MNSIHNPLVSLIVITYNSEKYILETLDSIRDQTYQNIELIISDDGSKDNTVEICNDWLSQNNDRFVHTELITVQQNSGIPANSNRGVKASSGEWIKLIAGDDILRNDAIAKYVSYCIEQNILFVFSDLKYFNDIGELQNYGSPILINKFLLKKSVKRKEKSYLRNSFFMNVPAIFYNKKVYYKNGGYNETFKMLEDLPFIVKTLQNGFDIKYIPEKLVHYRIHRNSITGSRNKSMIIDKSKFYFEFVAPFLCDGYVDSLFRTYHTFRLWVERNGFARNIIYRIFNKLTYNVINSFA